MVTDAHINDGTPWTEDATICTQPCAHCSRSFSFRATGPGWQRRKYCSLKCRNQHGAEKLSANRKAGLTKTHPGIKASAWRSSYLSAKAIIDEIGVILGGKVGDEVTVRELARQRMTEIERLRENKS